MQAGRHRGVQAVMLVEMRTGRHPGCTRSHLNAPALCTTSGSPKGHTQGAPAILTARSNVSVLPNPPTGLTLSSTPAYQRGCRVGCTPPCLALRLDSGRSSGHAVVPIAVNLTGRQACRWFGCETSSLTDASQFLAAGRNVRTLPGHLTAHQSGVVAGPLLRKGVGLGVGTTPGSSFVELAGALASPAVGTGVGFGVGTTHAYSAVKVAGPPASQARAHSSGRSVCMAREPSVSKSAGR